MGKVEKISVSLPKDMVEAIGAAVESGDYATTSEVVRDALRRWESDRAHEQAIRTYGLERLRGMVQEAIDSLDRGEGMTLEEVRAGLQARRARNRKKTA